MKKTVAKAVRVTISSKSNTEVELAIDLMGSLGFFFRHTFSNTSTASGEPVFTASGDCSKLTASVTNALLKFCRSYDLSFTVK